jgi:hypothetical protein
VYNSPSATASFNMHLVENGYTRHYESEFSRTEVYEEAAQQAHNATVGV